MFFVSYFFVSGLFALNVAVASIALGFAAFMVARLVRRDALSLRHAFLCVALTLMLASPLGDPNRQPLRIRYCPDYRWTQQIKANGSTSSPLHRRPMVSQGRRSRAPSLLRRQPVRRCDHEIKVDSRTNPRRRKTGNTGQVLPIDPPQISRVRVRPGDGGE